MTTTANGPRLDVAGYVVADTTVLLKRSLRHILRSPDTIITTTVTPVAMLLLFVYVFGSAIDTGGGRYVDYLLPGILLITVASGISYTAYRLFNDVPNWLAVVGILVLFTLALTWLAVIPGLTASSVDGVSGFSYPLIFLPFVSSAFVPTHGMPGPVRWFAQHQPVTSIVNTLRDLFAEQQPVGRDGWTALAWCVGLLLAAYALAVVTYRRRFG